MDLKTFRKEYSGAPYSLDEMACVVIDYLDELGNNKLYQAAEALIEAHRAFEKALEEANVELG